MLLTGSSANLVFIFIFIIVETGKDLERQTGPGILLLFAPDFSWPTAVSLSFFRQ